MKKPPTLFEDFISKLDPVFRAGVTVEKSTPTRRELDLKLTETEDLARRILGENNDDKD